MHTHVSQPLMGGNPSYAGPSSSPHAFSFPRMFLSPHAFSFPQTFLSPRVNMPLAERPGSSQMHKDTGTLLYEGVSGRGVVWPA